MKSQLFAAVTAVTILSSCSVYRSGQTPDDVYYSPGASKEQAAYVEASGDRNDGKRYNDGRTYNGYDDYATADDRWLMMRVRNRYRWSYFDDFNYYSPYNSFYSPYNSFGYYPWGGYGGYSFGYQPGFSFGLGFGSYYDPFMTPYYWNSYYNPYYPKTVIVNPKVDPAGYNRIRNFNLNTYTNRGYNNSRSVLRPSINGYNNNNNSRLGNSFRRVFSNSNSTAPRPSRSNDDYYRPSSSDRPTRTYSPSSSSNSTYSPSSSGSSSGGSSGSSSSGSRPNRR